MNEKIFIDVSIVCPEYANSMYNKKISKYSSYTEGTIVPIIFMKNITIHEKSRQYL